jgi:hypothetical protein
VCDGHEREIWLIGERVSPAFLWPQVVNAASVVIGKEGARSCLDTKVAVFLVSFEVGGDEVLLGHPEMRSNPGNIFVCDHHPQRAATIGAFRAIHDAERFLVQFEGNAVNLLERPLLQAS